MELKSFFDLVIKTIEENSVLIEKGETFCVYESPSGISDYRFLVDLTQHLQTSFSQCTITAYETNGQIEVAVSYQNETILLSFCVERWGNNRNAHIYYYKLDVRKRHILDATIDLFAHKALFQTIKEMAKTYIETMNKYRLYAVSGKGWEE